jgi:hypothetical protein
MQYLPIDICRELAKYLDTRAQGRMKCVSSFWNTLLDPTLGKSIHYILRKKRLARLRKHNPLLKLMQLDQHLNWHWHELSSNPNVTLEVVNYAKKAPWNVAALAVHPNFTYDDLMTIANKVDWTAVSGNPNVTIEMVLERGLDKYGFSDNPALTIEIVEKYPNFPWHWRCFSHLYKDNIKLVLKYIDKELSWIAISYSMPLQDIIDHPHLPWNWQYMGQRADITVETIQKLPKHGQCALIYSYWSSNSNITFRDISEAPWEHHAIINVPELMSRMKRLTIEDVKLHRHKCNERSTFWENASKSPLISFQDIYDNPDLPWNQAPKGPWGQVSENPNITMDIILKHRDFSWNWRYLSCHTNIKLTDILANPDLPWEWYWVTVNPNVTLDDILKYYPRMRGYTNVSKKSTCADLWIY